MAVLFKLRRMARRWKRWLSGCSRLNDRAVHWESYGEGLEITIQSNGVFSVHPLRAAIDCPMCGTIVKSGDLHSCRMVNGKWQGDSK